LRVPQSVTETPREPDAPVARSHDGSSGVFFINRATGSAIASLLVVLLIGIAYVGSTLFTRDHQFKHVKDQQKQMRRELDQMNAKNQRLERRMVELATHVENLEESGD
jgi:uncharacterized protein HemX